MGDNGLDATVGIQLDTSNAGRSSLISQSQYAKVIFHDVWDWYPADADIMCRYTVTKGVVFHPNDKIALLPVGWNSALDDAILVIPVPDQQPSATEGSYQGKVMLKVQDIAKDSSEFYQICYVSHTQPGRAVVCGASAPFQFRSPQECEEWCEVEDAEDGIVIVRSRAALDQENLQKAIEKGELLQQEKVKVEEQLQRITKELADSLLESGKLKTELEEMRAEGKKLEEKLGEMQDVQRYVVRLQGEARAIDSDRNETGNKLAHAQRHIEVLEATVSTLAADKEHMLGLLRSETQRGGELSKRLEEVLVERETLKNEVVALQEEKVKALSKLSAALKEVISLKSAVAEEKNNSKEVECLRERLVLTEKKLEASQKQTTEVEAKYEEQSKLLRAEQDEVKRLKEQVAEMQLRLEMAAEEYRKVYAANVRAERKLSKQLHSRGRSDDSGGGSRTRQSTASQPAPTGVTAAPTGVTAAPTDGETGEQKVLKDKVRPKGDGDASAASASSCNTADPSTGKVGDCGEKGIKMDKWHNLETLHDLNICFVCPICSVTFPPGESARFNVHFDNHLS